MKYFCLILFFISSDSWAGATYDQLTKGLPKDVIKMIDRRIGCNYWSGEMPNNASNPEVRESGRPQMIEKKLKVLKCTNLEKDEKTMRAKYKNKAKVLQALDDTASLTPAD